MKKSKPAPKVTVFMPTFNSQTFLVEAIESVRKQTHQNFELLILDGGSSDLTSEICRSYERFDTRIKFQVFEGTTPPVRFNSALMNCSTEYFFIAHSDDIQSPERLFWQINAFEQDSKLVMCGTATCFWLHDFATNCGNSYFGTANYPKRHDQIETQLLFWWCFANPTLAFRVNHFQTLGLKMSTEFRFGTDYLFYWDVAKTGKIENLERVLVAYRHHATSEGPANRIILEQEINTIREKILEDSGLGLKLDSKMRELYLKLKVERNLITARSGSITDNLRLIDIVFSFCRNNWPQAELHHLEEYRRQLAQQKHPILHKIKIGAKKFIPPIFLR